jgi:hypothetical protein
MIGDILEWIAAIAAVAAAYIYAGFALSIGVAAVFLFYQAQCHAERPLPKLFHRKSEEDLEAKLASGKYTAVMDDYDMQRLVPVEEAEELQALYDARKFARGRVTG